jgi:hypothetical protein
MPSETHADGIDGTVAVVQLDDADEVLKLFGGKVRDGLSGYPHHANGRDVTDGEAEVLFAVVEQPLHRMNDPVDVRRPGPSPGESVLEVEKRTRGERTHGQIAHRANEAGNRGSIFRERLAGQDSFCPRGVVI